MGEQQFRQCESHLPTPGELVGVSPEVALLEAEPAQHRSGLRLDGIATHALEAIANPTVLGEQRCVIRLVGLGYLLLEEVYAVLQ